MNKQTSHATSTSGGLTLHATTTRHNPTEFDMRDENSASGSPGDLLPLGLTPQQEKAAALLASGKGVNDVAQELNIHRSTVWAWRKLPTFEAYTNSLLHDLQYNARFGLLSLYGEAIETFRRVLSSDNGVAALKAATYIVERVKGIEVGRTDAREIVRRMCTTYERHELERVWDPTEKFDEERYDRLCAELGIAEESDAGSDTEGGNRQRDRQRIG